MHCVKSVCGPHSSAFVLNTETQSIYPFQSECGKQRTRTTPNTDTFCAVIYKYIYMYNMYMFI